MHMLYQTRKNRLFILILNPYNNYILYLWLYFILKALPLIRNNSIKSEILTLQKFLIDLDNDNYFLKINYFLKKESYFLEKIF